MKGGVKVQRLAGRCETVTLPIDFCENAWFFIAADAVKAKGFSAYKVERFARTLSIVVIRIFCAGNR